MTLPRYHVYTSFQQNGRNTGWVSGVTLPQPIASRKPAELRAKTAARYGKSGKEVEREYLGLLAKCPAYGTGGVNGGVGGNTATGANVGANGAGVAGDGAGLGEIGGEAAPIGRRKLT